MLGGELFRCEVLLFLHLSSVDGVVRIDKDVPVEQALFVGELGHKLLERLHLHVIHVLHRVAHDRRGCVQLSLWITHAVLCHMWCLCFAPEVLHFHLKLHLFLPLRLGHAGVETGIVLRSVG